MFVNAVLILHHWFTSTIMKPNYFILDESMMNKLTALTNATFIIISQKKPMTAFLK